MAESAREAAGKSVDEDRLLEGEDPKSRYLDDAAHWVTVYSQLLAVKSELLTASEVRLPALQPEARHEIASTDLVVLDAEMKRFSRRLGYWRQRCLELGAPARP
ncbi:MAG: hypothetical protein JF887_05030 [Candidatus Dormibacteraeota bacterium]|uniref:Uncharacterized protein n=1 Tax=Candidatus Amunia macphersoniae TaxID=3127014 RepID=A0A934NFL9_9BACT|nr:hypothetical protein [Candidatus Dormibacteraeota bacterium]